MAESDVIISWAHGSVPESSKLSFERLTAFLVLSNPDWRTPLANYGYPTPIRAILSNNAPGLAPLRVSILGFSASGQGVASILNSTDGGRIDAAVLIDGMHTGLPVTKAAMTPWIKFGEKAIRNEALFIVTHSSVVPPNYASTTQTANFLWKTLTGSDDASINPPLHADLTIPPVSVHVSGGPITGPDRTIDYPSAQWQPLKRAGGLIILGCDNLDSRGTADHIYQAKYVMPLVLSNILAARWNAIDPKSPDSYCYVG